MTFACQECGKKFKTVVGAERASRNGCPKCGGCDIDLDVLTPAQSADRFLGVAKKAGDPMGVAGVVAIAMRRQS